MSTIANLMVEVGADISGFTRGMDSADNRISGFGQSVSDNLSGAGRSLVSLGGSLSAITAPLIGFGTYAVASATQFNESMTNVGAVLNLTGDQITGLSDQVLAIGAASRAGPQAAAEAYYDIAGGVADASTHMAILNAAIATSEAGNASLTSTTSGLIAVMNAYNLKSKDASHISDVFTRTVGVGVGSMDEFVSALSPIAGVAASVGISFDDLGVQTAYMTTKGFTASQAATRMQAAMTAVLKPNQAMADALKAMGVESGSAALKQFGLAGTLGRLQNALGGSTDAMAEALGSTEALGAAMVLNQPGLEDFWTTYENGLNGATDAARNIQLTSAAAQFDLLKSAASGLAIEVGQNLTVMLGGLAAAVTPIISGITSWAQAHPELMAQLTPLIAAVALAGPAILAVGTAMTLAAPAVGVMAGAFALLVSPIGLVVAGLVALGVAYTQNLGGLKDFVDTNIAPLASTIMATVQGLDFGGVASTIQSSVSNALSNASTEGIDLSSLQTGITDGFSGLDFSGVGDIMNTHFNDILTAIVSVAGIVFGGPISLLIGAARLVGLAIENDFLGIGTFLNTTGITDAVNSALTDVKTAIDAVISQVFGGGGGQQIGDGQHQFLTDIVPQNPEQATGPLQTFISDLQTGFDALKQVVSDVWANLEPGITSLVTGIQGFVQAFADTDTDGLLRVVTAIGGVIGGLLGAAVELGSDVIGTFLTATGNALPMFGEAISDLISTVSQIGSGDFASAATSLGDVVTDIVNSILDFVGIQIDVPDFSTAIQGWQTGLEGIKAVIDSIVTSIQTAIDNFKLTVRNAVASALSAIIDIQIAGTQFQIDLGINVGGNQGFLAQLQARKDALAKGDLTGGLGIPAAAGGAMVDSTGLVLVHAGERILNPAETSAYNSGNGGNTINVSGVNDVDQFLFELKRRGIQVVAG